MDSIWRPAAKVYIIGVGDDGLDGLVESARQHVSKAEILIGSPRNLAAVPDGRVFPPLLLTDMVKCLTLGTAR